MPAAPESIGSSGITSGAGEGRGVVCAVAAVGPIQAAAIVSIRIFRVDFHGMRPSPRSAEHCMEK
jgi:hypothetical protein